MLVMAAPIWSLILVMWYSLGPGYASNCHPNSEPQNSRPLPVSSAGISICTIWPGMVLLSIVRRRALAPPRGHSIDAPFGGDSSAALRNRPPSHRRSSGRVGDAATTRVGRATSHMHSRHRTHADRRRSRFCRPARASAGGPETDLGGAGSELSDATRTTATETRLA